MDESKYSHISHSKKKIIYEKLKSCIGYIDNQYTQIACGGQKRVFILKVYLKLYTYSVLLHANSKEAILCGNEFNDILKK